MNLIAVAAPVSVHAQVSATPNVDVQPLTASNYLGGAAILTVLAAMVAVGLNAAGMTPKSHAHRVGTNHHHAH
jgi:hypothetical protein